jgi:hypothetical protein
MKIILSASVFVLHNTKVWYIYVYGVGSFRVPSGVILIYRRMKMANAKLQNIGLKCIKDEAFKKELLSHPKTTLEKEFGETLPADVRVQIILADPNTITIVIPNLEGKSLSDKDLENILGGGSWLANVAAYG